MNETWLTLTPPHPNPGSHSRLGFMQKIFTYYISSKSLYPGKKTVNKVSMTPTLMRSPVWDSLKQPGEQRNRWPGQGRTLIVTENRGSGSRQSWQSF